MKKIISVQFPLFFFFKQRVQVSNVVRKNKNKYIWGRSESLHMKKLYMFCYIRTILSWKAEKAGKQFVRSLIQVECGLREKKNAYKHFGTFWNQISSSIFSQNKVFCVCVRNFCVCMCLRDQLGVTTHAQDSAELTLCPTVFKK